eukprot:2806989-Pyramimonas_sp.AAC.1
MGGCCPKTFVSIARMHFSPGKPGKPGESAFFPGKKQLFWLCVTGSVSGFWGSPEPCATATLCETARAQSRHARRARIHGWRDRARVARLGLRTCGETGHILPPLLRWVLTAI